VLFSFLGTKIPYYFFPVGCGSERKFRSGTALGTAAHAEISQRMVESRDRPFETYKQKIQRNLFAAKTRLLSIFCDWV
jgi:hypothetical protein